MLARWIRAKDRGFDQAGSWAQRGPGCRPRPQPSPPEYRGEGEEPLTPALSPEYRGEGGWASGDGDGLVEVDVLDDVQEADAFVHGALESFAAADEAHAAGALVDDRRLHGFLQIAFAR